MDKLSWNTEFITADDLMVHTFSDRVQVVTNIKTGEIKTLRDGKVIDRRTDMPISEYERFLLMIAKDANKLKDFTDYRKNSYEKECNTQAAPATQLQRHPFSNG